MEAAGLEARIREAFDQQLERGGLDAQGLEVRLGEAFQQELEQDSADQAPVTPAMSRPPTSAFMSPAPEGMVNETGSTMESSREPDYVFQEEVVNLEDGAGEDRGGQRVDLGPQPQEQELVVRQLTAQGRGVATPSGQGTDPVPVWRRRMG